MRHVDEYSFRYPGWAVVLGGSLSLLLTTTVVFGFPILLKPLAEEFSWSRETVSTAYSAMALLSGLAAAPVGVLVDRVGVRAVVVVGLVSLGSLLASLSLLTPRPWHLDAIYGVLGALATCASPVAYARAITSWFARRRGIALAIAISGGAVGAIIHPPLAQALVDGVGWRMAYAILGGGVLIVGAPVVAMLIHDRASSASDTTRTGPGVSARASIGTRAFWILLGLVFSSSLLQSSTTVHLSALMTDRGISASDAATVLSMFGVASLAGRLGTGWLVDHFLATRIALLLLAAATGGALLLSDAGTFTAGIVAAMLIGFGTSGETDVAPYLLSRYFGLRSFSTLYGLVWMAHTGAAAIGPVLMGRAFDSTGSYEAMLVRLAIGALVVSMLLLTMPRYAALKESAPATV